jgi:hypothetical protein
LHTRRGANLSAAKRTAARLAPLAKQAPGAKQVRVDKRERVAKWVPAAKVCQVNKAAPARCRTSPVLGNEGTRRNKDSHKRRDSNPPATNVISGRRVMMQLMHSAVRKLERPASPGWMRQCAAKHLDKTRSNGPAPQWERAALKMKICRPVAPPKRISTRMRGLAEFFASASNRRWETTCAASGFHSTIGA